MDDKRQKLFRFLERALAFDVSAATDMSVQAMLDMIERVQPDLMDEALRVLNPDQAVEVPSRTHFHCPVIQETLQVACQAKSCRYWVDYAVTDNCLQAFLKKYQQDTMSLTEISYVTQLTLATISRLHTAGLTRMRQHAVSGVLNFDDLEQEFVLVPNAKVCVACESYIGY